MRADYDSEGDTVQIELEPVRNAGRAEDVENGAVIVSIHDYRWGDPPASFTRMGHRAPHRGAPQGGWWSLTIYFNVKLHHPPADCRLREGQVRWRRGSAPRRGRALWAGCGGPDRRRQGGPRRSGPHDHAGCRGPRRRLKLEKYHPRARWGAGVRAGISAAWPALQAASPASTGAAIARARPGPAFRANGACGGRPGSRPASGFSPGSPGASRRTSPSLVVGVAVVLLDGELVSWCPTRNW